MLARGGSMHAPIPIMLQLQEPGVHAAPRPSARGPSKAAGATPLLPLGRTNSSRERLPAPPRTHSHRFQTPPRGLDVPFRSVQYRSGAWAHRFGACAYRFGALAHRFGAWRCGRPSGWRIGTSPAASSAPAAPQCACPPPGLALRNVPAPFARQRPQCACAQKRVRPLRFDQEWVRPLPPAAGPPASV